MTKRGGKNCALRSCYGDYCADCVKMCKNCPEDIHPKYADRHSVPLDEAVKAIIDETDISIDLLGDDAKDGDTIYLCKKCLGKWKRHPQRGKPFPGFTKEEIDHFNGVTSLLG